LGLGIFFTMNVMVFSMALWSWDTYDIAAGAAGETLRGLFRHACLLFSAPVMVLLGGPLWTSSQESLRAGRINTDGLLLGGVIAAFAFSVLSLWRGDPHVYFEVACVILVFVTLGRWLEATGKQRATQALQSLRKVLPDTVRCVTDAGESVRPLAAAARGDLLRILAGERVPVDGLVERSAGMLDEQLVTGESLPRWKQVGQPVYGGTLNLDGDLYVRASGTANDGTVQRIADRVAEAVLTKGKEQRFADRLAQWFTPLIILIATATFVVHLRMHDFPADLMSALAVELIDCK
jgi:cation transport ATPase